MPIYEYACRKCEKRFEKLIKAVGRDDVKVECPECGSSETEKALSVFAVSASAGAKPAAGPGMCGRCGGPGPCANG